MQTVRFGYKRGNALVAPTFRRAGRSREFCDAHQPHGTRNGRQRSRLFQNWASHAQRHRKNRLKHDDWEIAPITIEEYLAAYKRSHG